MSVSRAAQAFINSEAAGGVILIGSAGLALILANSPLAPTYFGTLDAHVGPFSILHWINDALMALFFLLIGLEIKREFVGGELSTWPRRILPGIAAAGGMVVPAAIYVALNAGEPASLRGWAVPTATDIAFALGVLSLLGSRVPASLKLFLTALAIIDDLGAVAIIAALYTSGLDLLWLGLAIAAWLSLWMLNRSRVVALAPYLLIGAILWFFVYRSGVHATLAGVALAIAIPIRRDGPSPVHRLEHRLQPWVGFLVVPLFGFANAGVPLSGIGASDLLSGVPLGIAAGLFFGKQLGVFISSWAAIRLKLAEPPEGASFIQLYGVSLLCGIGFTMSLFIGLLAFPDAPHLQDSVKLGVLAGSMASALAGVWILVGAKR